MSAKSSVDYRSVFINCPFDYDYLPLLRAACFAIMACGLRPRCALEFGDGGASRFGEIVKLMGSCGFAIHDISRVKLDKRSKMPRFNMPLELGADFGLRFAGSKDQKARKMMILDAEPHRYDKSLSDLSGNDIEVHGNDTRRIIGCVRDWLRKNWDSSWGNEPAGAGAIAADHDFFQKHAPDIMKKLRLDPNDLHHADYLKVVEVALPMIAAANSSTP